MFASKYKGGAWGGGFDSEMWKKTALKRLSKRIRMDAPSLVSVVDRGTGEILATEGEMPPVIENKEDEG